MTASRRKRLAVAAKVVAATADENGTDIFRPYLKPNSFREVQMCSYPSLNI